MKNAGFVRKRRPIFEPTIIDRTTVNARSADEGVFPPRLRDARDKVAPPAAKYAYLIRRNLLLAVRRPLRTRFQRTPERMKNRVQCEKSRDCRTTVVRLLVRPRRFGEIYNNRFNWSSVGERRQEPTVRSRFR